MRFSFASVALLALAQLASGVHGAPAVVSDHTNSLAVRQLDCSTITSLVTDLLQSLGSLDSNAPELAQLVQQIAQELQKRTASSMVPRALSSGSASPAPSTSLPTPFPTTTNHLLAVSTDQMGGSTVSSVSTPHASSTPQTRMRRQLPLALPTTPAVASIVGSQSIPLPVQSVAASALSRLGALPSQSAVSKPTPSKP